MRQIIIYGASNPEDLRLARAWVDRVEVNPYEIIFWDDKKTGNYLGIPIERPSDHNNVPMYQKPFVFNCVCSNTAAREKAYNEIRNRGLYPEPLIAPSAIVNDQTYSETSGVYIQDNVVVQAGCKIGANVSIHMGSLIGHETIVEPHVFIAHGVNISGRCFIGERAYIGAGATLLPNIVIGADALVGAGSVVTKDVPVGTTVKGVPAK